MQRIQDQFTRPLLSGPSRSNLIKLFATALVGASDVDERNARAQQVALDLRRPASSSIVLDAQHFVADLDAVDARRSDPEYQNELAVGEQCGDWCPPGPNASVMCTADGRRICDYDRVGARTESVAGQGIITLNPQPSAGFSWWVPRLVRMFAHDVVNPSIPRWEGDFLTSITIGSHPVEGFSNPATVGQLSGIHMGDFVVPDNSGVPVGWSAFSNDANSNGLAISGISLWQAGINQFAYITIMGNPSRDGAFGNTGRCHPGSVPCPPCDGGGGRSGTRNYRNPGQGSRPL